MQTKFIHILAATGLASVAAPAWSATLTFDSAANPGAQPACSTTEGGATNKLCNHLDFIGSDYGSTPLVAVSYDAGGTATALRAYTAGFYPDGGVINFAGGADPSLFSNITFTPTAGYEVALQSWTYTNGSATGVNYFFEIRDAQNNLIASHTDTFAGSFTANTAYFDGPLTFRFRNVGGGAVIDNIAFDVRAITTTAVPEPASWALMVGGFGLIGGGLRRRHAAPHLTAV